MQAKLTDAAALLMRLMEMRVRVLDLLIVMYVIWLLGVAIRYAAKLRKDKPADTTRKIKEAIYSPKQFRRNRNNW